MFLYGLMALPTEGPSNAFYDSWGTYMHAYPRVWLNMMQVIGQSLMAWFYDIANGVYEAWQHSWKLMSFANIFTLADGSGEDATGMGIVQLIPIVLMIGLIVFAIVMVYQILQFTLTDGKKGKDWPKGIVTIIFVIALTPTLIDGGLKISQGFNERVMTLNNKNPMIDIIENNTVDMKKVAEKGFEVEPSDLRTYSPVKGSQKRGNQDSIVNDPIFTATMSDGPSQKGLDDSIKDVFTKKKGPEDEPEKLDGGSWVTGGAFKEEYARVKVNWVVIIACLGMFAVAVFLAIIELLLRFYRLAMYTISMLYFAIKDASGKTALQMLQIMEGAITGAAIMPLSIVMYFAFINLGIKTAGNLDLNWWVYGVLVGAILLAAMKGLMTGFSLIDQLTGVPSGQSNAAQTAMAGLMAAKAAGSMGKAAAQGVTNTAKAGAAVGGAAIAGIDKAHAKSQAMSEKMQAKWAESEAASDKKQNTNQDAQPGQGANPNMPGGQGGNSDSTNNPNESPEKNSDGMNTNEQSSDNFDATQNQNTNPDGKFASNETEQVPFPQDFDDPTVQNPDFGYDATSNPTEGQSQIPTEEPPFDAGSDFGNLSTHDPSTGMNTEGTQQVPMPADSRYGLGSDNSTDSNRSSSPAGQSAMQSNTPIVKPTGHIASNSGTNTRRNQTTHNFASGNNGNTANKFTTGGQTTQPKITDQLKAPVLGGQDAAQTAHTPTKKEPLQFENLEEMFPVPTLRNDK